MKMRGRLDNATFATKREIVESLPLYGTIALEGDVKAVWLHWHIYKFTLYIENTASSTRIPAMKLAEVVRSIATDDATLATLLRRMVLAGQYGRKSGRGFYEYEHSGASIQESE